MKSISPFAVSVASRNLLEAMAKSRQLYRRAFREIPQILQHYEAEVELQQAQRRIREEFRKHAKVQDCAIVDRLVFRGSGELEEAIQMWKTKSHIMTFFDPDPFGTTYSGVGGVGAPDPEVKPRGEKSYLDAFFEAHDPEASDWKPL